VRPFKSVGASAAPRDCSLQRPTRLISASAGAAMPEKARSDIDVAPNAKAGRPNAPRDAAIGYSLLAAKGTGPRCLQLLSMWAAKTKRLLRNWQMSQWVTPGITRAEHNESALPRGAGIRADVAKGLRRVQFRTKRDLGYQ
jgi:hypothetical protein